LSKEDDIGLRDMVVDGINGYDFIQTDQSQHLMPMAKENQPGNLAVVDRDVRDNLELIQTGSSTVPPSGLPFNADGSVVQRTYPGDLSVVER
jgi:hypothetical protein